MSDQVVVSKTLNSTGGAGVNPHQKTILDFLIQSKNISQEEADRIRSRFSDNFQIEQELRKGNLSSQKIAEAYSEFFGLPIANLKGLKVDPSLQELLPAEVKDKYGALVYEKTKDQSGKTVYKIAIGYPARLGAESLQILREIQGKNNCLVKLSIGTPEMMADAQGVPTLSGEASENKISQTIEEKKKVSSSPAGQIQEDKKMSKANLKGQHIPYRFLARFPIDVSKRYRMVVFDAPQAGKIKVALEDPESEVVRTILNFIRERNKITIEEYLADKSEIEEILQYYQKREAEENKRKGEEPVKRDNLPTSIQQTPQKEQVTFRIEKEEPIKKDIEKINPDKEAIIDELFDKKPADKLIVPEKKVEEKPLPTKSDALPQQTQNLKSEDQLNQPEKKGLLSKFIPIKTGKSEDGHKEVKETPVKIEETHAAREVEKSAIDERAKQLETLAALGGKNAVPLPNSSIALTREEHEAVKEKDKLDTEEKEIEKRIDKQASGIQEQEERTQQIEEMKKLETELAKRSESNISDFLDEEIDTVEKLKEIINTASVPKIMAAILNYALFKRASDIHIEPTNKEVRVRYRIDGILYDIISAPRYFRNAIVSRIKILSKLKIDEQRVPQDGRFSVIYHKTEVDFRVSTLPTVNGEKVVIRILDKSAGILTLEELGVSGTNFDRLMDNIEKPYGVIASCGPTGSGKTTSLYAILHRLSTPGVNVVTLEDPVEYEMPGINQCQVKPKIGFGFAEGLRSVLRQDPNIVMVGEVRDSETANMVTHAALTGHLVLTTLHTNEAAGALPRLTNMGVEPFLITSSVNCIIGQRLVRRICPKCKEEVKIHQNVEEAIKKKLENIKGTKDYPENLEFKFYKGKGCSECHLGYKGRIGIFEVLVMTDEIENIAIKHAPTSVIQTQAVKEGMMVMEQDGLLKAIKGITTLDEVIRATSV